MNTLRVLGSQEEFELVSMDYCITYEVSPPTWQNVRCHRAYGPHRDSPAKHGAKHGAKDDSQQGSTSGPLTEVTPLVTASANRVELVGDVLGAVAAELQPLQSALELDGDLLISCERLIRVDFSAAGSILNWVASAQAQGKKIEFYRLTTLVATFFNLIGINEHAQVTARAN
jgi:ABC-type transporter Mla MlaB component